MCITIARRINKIFKIILYEKRKDITMNNIIIRKAKKSDFKQIHNLILQVHNIHVKERPDIYRDTDPLDMKMYEKELLDINNIYLVAENKNNIVGFCFAEIRELSNNKIMKDRKIMHIKDICINILERRNGIGTLLYNELVKLAQNKKVDSIELMVWGFNEDAINFYKKIGMNIKNLRFEKKL